MHVHLEIPEEFARHLASDAKGLARAALEALAADAVRSGRLTTFQARGLLLDLTLEEVQKDSDTALASVR